MQNRYKTRTDTRVMIHREYIIIYDEDDGVGIYIPIIFCWVPAAIIARGLWPTTVYDETYGKIYAHIIPLYT